MNARLRAPGLSSIVYARVEHAGEAVDVTFDPYAKTSRYYSGGKYGPGLRYGVPERRRPFPPGLLAACLTTLADVIAHPEKYRST